MKIAVDARTLGSRPSGVGMYLNDFLMDYSKAVSDFMYISDLCLADALK